MEQTERCGWSKLKGVGGAKWKVWVEQNERCGWSKLEGVGRANKDVGGANKKLYKPSLSFQFARTTTF